MGGSRRATGPVDESGAFTDAGREQRERLGEATDPLAFAAYAGLGDEAWA